MWLGKEDASSSVMTARTNGRSPTGPQDQQDARNATARTFTERQVTEDTQEGERGEEEVGDVDSIRIAIPCTGQANLQTEVSPHFGRCDSYAIVTIEDGRVKAIESICNTDHSDCAGSVRTLFENGVSLMLVRSMGMRPYLAFKQVGIEVRCGTAGTVADAVESYLNGETSPMTEDDLCGHHMSTNGYRRCEDSLSG